MTAVILWIELTPDLPFYETWQNKTSPRPLPALLLALDGWVSEMQKSTVKDIVPLAMTEVMFAFMGSKT